MAKGYKETLEEDIRVEFSNQPRVSYGPQQIAKFAAQSLKESKITSKEIAEALVDGILITQQPKLEF